MYSIQYYTYVLVNATYTQTIIKHLGINLQRNLSSNIKIIKFISFSSLRIAFSAPWSVCKNLNEFYKSPESFYFSES